MTYKIMFNLVDLNIDKFFPVGTNKITRGHQYTFVKPCVKFVPVCKVRSRSNILACRVVDSWNNLDAKSNSLSHLMH